MQSSLIINQLWPNISQSIFRATESNDMQNIQADINFMGTKIYVQETLYNERTCMKRIAFLMHKFFETLCTNLNEYNINTEMLLNSNIKLIHNPS